MNGATGVYARDQEKASPQRKRRKSAFQPRGFGAEAKVAAPVPARDRQAPGELLDAYLEKKNRLEQARGRLPNLVIQRNDIELSPIRARTATCVTRGVEHEGGKSFASVVSTATHMQETDYVVYEIAWDAAVAPVGHEGMQVTPNVASDFVVDRSQTGEAIGQSRRHYRKDDPNGWVFEYRDGIEWPVELNGGTWRFRLRVMNGAGTEVARSAVAIVDWNH